MPSTEVTLTGWPETAAAAGFGAAFEAVFEAGLAAVWALAAGDPARSTTSRPSPLLFERRMNVLPECLAASRAPAKSGTNTTAMGYGPRPCRHPDAAVARTGSEGRTRS